MKSGSVFSFLLSCSILGLAVAPVRAAFEFTGTVLQSPYVRMDGFPQSLAAWKNRLLGSDFGSYNNGSCSPTANHSPLVRRNAVVYDFSSEGSGNFTRQVLLNSTVPVTGLALAMNNASAIIGNPYQNSAFQFLYDGKTYQQAGKLVPVPDTYSCYSSAMAMNRHWLAIAAPYTWEEKSGKVYIYRWVQGRWRFAQILSPSNKKHAIHFGQRLVMNDYLLAVTGSPYETTQGRFQDVYVYYPDKFKWQEMGSPIRQRVDSEESSAIAVVKDRLVLSTVNEGTPLKTVSLYEFNGKKWESRNSAMALSNAGFGYNLQTIDDHTLLISAQNPGELLVYSVHGGSLSDTGERISCPGTDTNPGFGDLTAYSDGLLYAAVRGIH